MVLLVLSGCLYWPRLIEEELNQAPTIVASDPREGAPVELWTDTWVFVQAYDENDPDGLEFVWTLSGLGQQGGAMPIAGQGRHRGSQLFVVANPAYDGRTLSVTINDSFDGQVSRSWELIVPEEAP